jgi:hypothetical protein
MKTKDLKTDDGILIGLIVNNFLISRHSIPRILKSVVGASIIRSQKRFAFSGTDDFCEFQVGGTTFLAIEPFGDNSEYWIVTEPPEYSEQIEVVRQAFSKKRVLFGLLAG